MGSEPMAFGLAPDALGGTPPQGATPSKSIVVTLGDTAVKVKDRVFYLENISAGIVLKVAFDNEAEVILEPGFRQIGEQTIWYRPIDIKPPQLMVTIQEYLDAVHVDPKELYTIVRDWVDLSLEHPLEQVKDIITLYIIYTWFHRFYSKKAFLLVTGFYGTGKSVVGNLLKAFGRYTIQTEPGAKTSEWEVALLMGTMLIDEAETLKRQHLAKIRRMHDEGYAVSKMMGAPGGWMVITLNLSSPVALIGTHLPEDPALVSRGIVVKMHYGRPREKPPTINSPIAREFRATALKTMIKYHHKFIGLVDEIESNRPRDLNMRELDIYTPLCATAKLCSMDKLCDTLKLFIKLSSYIAQTLTPGRRLATLVARYILDKGDRIGRFIRIPEAELYQVVHALAKHYNVDPKDAKYVLQYFLSASYTRREGDEIMLYFLEEDINMAKGEEVDILDWFKSVGYI